MFSFRPFSVKKVTGSGAERVSDSVAVEEPLAIFIKHWQKDIQTTQSLVVTMRTPGNDRELAAGLLLAEGVVRGLDDVLEIRALGNEPSNEILVELAKGCDFEAWRQARNGFVSSSCGVCGKRSVEAVAQDMPAASADSFKVSAELIRRLPDLLRDWQVGFEQTGGLHAAALVTAAGEVEAAFEDIGRHNALDKLCGWALLGGRVPLREHVVFMSSRGSFELVQKAAMAGARILATVGGPSSLAIETAQELGITLIGFVRDGRFNVYSGDWRLDL